MIRSILVFFLLCGSAFADVEGIASPEVEGLSSSTVEGISIGETCTEGSTTDVCTSADGQASIDTYAKGIIFTASSSYSEYGHSFRVNVASGSGVVEIRVGTSDDLSTYTAKMQLTVTNTDTDVYVDGQWTDSSGNPMKVDFANTTTYYIGMASVSGDTVRWQRNTIGTTCSGQSGVYAGSEGWDMSSTNAYDWNHKSVRCSE